MATTNQNCEVQNTSTAIGTSGKNTVGSWMLNVNWPYIATVYSSSSIQANSAGYIVDGTPQEQQISITAGFCIVSALVSVSLYTHPFYVSAVQGPDSSTKVYRGEIISDDENIVPESPAVKAALKRLAKEL